MEESRPAHSFCLTLGPLQCAILEKYLEYLGPLQRVIVEKYLEYLGPLQCEQLEYLEYLGATLYEHVEYLGATVILDVYLKYLGTGDIVNLNIWNISGCPASVILQMSIWNIWAIL